MWSGTFMMTILNFNFQLSIDARPTASPLLGKVKIEPIISVQLLHGCLFMFWRRKSMYFLRNCQIKYQFFIKIGAKLSFCISSSSELTSRMQGLRLFVDAMDNAVSKGVQYAQQTAFYSFLQKQFRFSLPSVAKIIQIILSVGRITLNLRPKSCINDLLT